VPPEAGRVRFHDLGLPDEILHAVADLGFRYCMPVQAEAIPPALRGRDIYGRAQTGTGKTAAFLIAIFTRFLRHPRTPTDRKGQPRALILAPTRELALQIGRDAEALGRYCPFSTLVVFGGMDYEKQRRILSTSSPDIVVATPGRLLDFRGGGLLDLRRVEILVIDEADRMLDMGFIPDVRSIVHAIPRHPPHQTMLFSATLTSEITRLAARWTHDPVTVEIAPTQVEVPSIEQVVYTVAARHKFTLLFNLLEQKHLTRVLLFCNRRDQTARVVDRLERHGINCGMLSGAVPQAARLRILEDFRAGRVRVLVATDVAGRGLHVEQISHVINYDIPDDSEDYVHRIGRTGRAGAAGAAITFASEDDAFALPGLEAYLGHPLAYVNPDPAMLTPLPPLPPGKHPPREACPVGHPSRPTRGRRPRRRR
jgi:ATP-dependent RNA helicase RhlB